MQGQSVTVKFGVLLIASVVLFALIVSVLPGATNALPALETDAVIEDTHLLFMPVVTRGVLSPIVERRALWLTRYDWIPWNTSPTPEMLESVIAKAHDTGFNTILFQVRAAGDAFYTPGLEPWSQMLTAGPVSTTLGVDPGWDPLAVAIDAAHEVDMELHAYVNVYTAWLVPYTDTVGLPLPPVTSPPQMYDRFTFSPGDTPNPGVYGLGDSWRQYGAPGEPMPVIPSSYVWASPGADVVQDYVIAVINDINTRYAVDGIHLDYVRYAGEGYSYDPFSVTAVGSEASDLRADWQRQRISSFVARVQADVHNYDNGLVTAAVWPYYKDSFGWGTSSGYDEYYQDSKGWLLQGDIDAIMPMLYNGPADDITKWTMLMHDFLDCMPEAQVYPGIGAHYDDFGAITNRILTARQAGAPGHAIFSFGALDQHGYWDDLKLGPYLVPAHLP